METYIRKVKITIDKLTGKYIFYNHNIQPNQSGVSHPT